MLNSYPRAVFPPLPHIKKKVIHTTEKITEQTGTYWQNEQSLGLPHSDLTQSISRYDDELLSFLSLMKVTLLCKTQLPPKLSTT